MLRDCFTTGQAMTLGDIANEGDSWPEFQRSASRKATGPSTRHRCASTVDTIGTMNLFHTTVGALNERDIALAPSITDVATIAILQERGTRHLRDLSTQPQRALDSRIVIEQAKGLIAQSLNLTIDEAFGVLRTHARSTNQTLQTLARAVTERRLVLTTQHHAASGGEKTDSAGPLLRGRRHAAWLKEFSGWRCGVPLRVEVDNLDSRRSALRAMGTWPLPWCSPAWLWHHAW